MIDNMIIYSHMTKPHSMEFHIPQRYQSAPPVQPEAKRALLRYAQMIVWHETKSQNMDARDYRDELLEILNGYGITAEQISRAIFEETARKESMTPSLIHHPAPHTSRAP